jgi:hypothetical protein
VCFGTCIGGGHAADAAVQTMQSHPVSPPIHSSLPHREPGGGTYQWGVLADAFASATGSTSAQIWAACMSRQGCWIAGYACLCKRELSITRTRPGAVQVKTQKMNRTPVGSLPSLSALWEPLPRLRLDDMNVILDRIQDAHPAQQYRPPPPWRLKRRFSLHGTVGFVGIIPEVFIIFIYPSAFIALEWCA